MLGLSQDNLGKEIGVTFQQIQKYERGVNKVGAGRLYDFAKILNVPVNYFFEELDYSSGLSSLKQPGFAEEDDSEYKDSKEVVSLIRAYNKINDQIIRKKLLALIKALSDMPDDIK